MALAVSHVSPCGAGRRVPLEPLVWAAPPVSLMTPTVMLGAQFDRAVVPAAPAPTTSELWGQPLLPKNPFYPPPFSIYERYSNSWHCGDVKLAIFKGKLLCPRVWEAIPKSWDERKPLGHPETPRLYQPQEEGTPERSQDMRLLLGDVSRHGGFSIKMRSQALVVAVSGGGNRSIPGWLGLEIIQPKRGHQSGSRRISGGF